MSSAVIVTNSLDPDLAQQNVVPDPETKLFNTVVKNITGKCMWCTPVCGVIFNTFHLEKRPKPELKVQVYQTASSLIRVFTAC